MFGEKGVKVSTKRLLGCINPPPYTNRAAACARTAPTSSTPSPPVDNSGSVRASERASLQPGCSRSVFCLHLHHHPQPPLQKPRVWTCKDVQYKKQQQQRSTSRIDAPIGDKVRQRLSEQKPPSLRMNRGRSRFGSSLPFADSG